MKRLLLSCSLLGAAVAGLTYPVVLILDHGGTDAYLLDPFEDDKVAMNSDPSMLDLPAKTHPDFPRKVMEIYGIPTQETNRLVFVDESRVLHPPQLPSLTLYRVYKQKGENPLQVKTLYFFARYIVGVSAPVSLLLFAVYKILARRARLPADPPETKTAA